MNKPAILSNPEAFVVVPVEPIREQWAAMADTLYRYKNRHHDKVAGDVFNALLSARPDPTALADIVAYCAALEARLAEAERVIEPFAKRAGKLDGLWGDHDTQWSPEYGSVAITIGDLRAARAWKENGNG